MKMLFSAGVFCALLVSGLFGTVQAASFDCGKATTKVEKMICADEDLSKLDEKLAEAYKTALHSEKQPNVLQQAQKQWLKKRNDCVDVSCAKHAYETRLQALTATVMKAPTKGANKAGPGQPNAAHPAQKPRYVHCVDVLDRRSCGMSSGKGYTICEKYLKYLNALPAMPRCELPMPADFQRPAREELDVMQHLELAHQVETKNFEGYSWYVKQDFESWKRDFLAEIAAGKITPAMHKVRVTSPDDGKKLTLLAYTRDKKACQDVARKIKTDDYPSWSDVGYVHYIIPEAAETTSEVNLQKINRTNFQQEIFLYAGKPYFVKAYSPAYVETPAVAIFSLGASYRSPEELDTYLLRDFCIFEAIEK